MHRKRWTVVLVVVAAAAVGLSQLIGTAAGQSKGKSAANVVAKPTIISVTLGKPSEFQFKFSRSLSMIKEGPVQFNVTNLGVIGHDFKVCAKPVTSSDANTCVGKKTVVLAKGKKATLTLTLKKGKYLFLCSVSGHAKNGMKGLMGVGVALSTKELKPVSTPSTGPTKVEEGSCPSPVSTTINVNMGDYFFQGAPPSIRCGNVSVSAPNIGLDEHNITFAGKAAGEIVHAGMTAQQTLFLGVGVYGYICDVGDHAAQGMAGSLTVTA